MRSSVALVLAACASICATGAACSPRDEAVWLKKTSPEMAEAMKSAQASLPVFWKRIDSGDPDVTSPMVKVGYPTAHGGVEYLWMEVEAHSGDTVTGRIANTPEDVPDVHEGERVVVDLVKIIDWAYFKNEKSFGQFTTRVLLVGADAEKQREFGGDLLAPNPIESESN